MPVLHRDEEDLSRTQDAGQEWGLGKPGEPLHVGILHVNLRKAKEVTGLLSETGCGGGETAGHTGPPGPPGSCCEEGACHEDTGPLTPAGSTAGCTSCPSPARKRAALLSRCPAAPAAPRPAHTPGEERLPSLPLLTGLDRGAAVSVPHVY